MKRPLGAELQLASDLAQIVANLGANLAHAGQCWLAPGQQVNAIKAETNAWANISRARILLDTIEQGLTK